MKLDASQFRAERDRFVQQLERFRAGLQLMAVHRLGSADAAEEAIQETLARAVLALANGRPADPARVPAFVAGIARHVIADVTRARRRLVPLDSLGGSEYPAVEADALNALVSAAERARVRAALSELRPDDRELLRLCYFEGLTPTELAARLGEPAERIRKRKSRALERLRAAFLGRHTSHESAMVST